MAISRPDIILAALYTVASHLTEEEGKYHETEPLLAHTDGRVPPGWGPKPRCAGRTDQTHQRTDFETKGNAANRFSGMGKPGHTVTLA